MEQETKNVKFSTILLQFLFCFIGVVFTVGVVALENNPIVASALVSIVIGFFTVIINDEHHYSWATFCGSFAGMTNINFLDWNTQLSYLSSQFLLNILILSSLTALLYSISEFFSIKYPKIFFDGYGGRLGTIAFLSVAIFLFLTVTIHPNEIFPKIISSPKTFNIYEIPNPNPNNDILHKFDPMDILVIFIAILASLVSMEIKNTASSLNDNYKVITVATTGIIGGILIWEIPVYGNLLAQAWYTGAFVGMTSYFVLMLKKDYLITGFISGIILILTKSLFVGFGGKLGFISFIAVIIVRLYRLILNKIISARLNSKTVLENIKSGDLKNQTVDDDYARQLVENLQKAKESGENIMEDFSITESFVIGEKEEYVSDNGNSDDKIKEISGLIENLSIFSWCCFGSYGDDFFPLLYNGINDETLMKLTFHKNSNFIKKFSNENRLVSFTRKNRGLEQKFFINRISKDELDTTNMIILYPMIKDNELNNFFIIFDKNDLETTKNNLNLLNQYFNS